MTVELTLSKKSFTPEGLDEPMEYISAEAEIFGETFHFYVKLEEKKLLKYLLKDMPVTEED